MCLRHFLRAAVYARGSLARTGQHDRSPVTRDSDSGLTSTDRLVRARSRRAEALQDAIRTAPACGWRDGCPAARTSPLSCCRGNSWEAWRKLTATEVLTKISSLREQILARLKTLQADDFLRVGVHPKFGEMTVALWLEFFLLHEGHHLYVVLQQVRSLAGARAGS